MDLMCEKCGEVLSFGDAELRVAPVERGDAQAFQVRDASGKESVHVFRCKKCGGIRAKASAPTDLAPAAPNGTACDDGNPNTANDVCTAGVCAGTSSAPTNKAQCKNGGWRRFTNPRFKNQGACVAFVEHGR